MLCAGAHGLLGQPAPNAQYASESTSLFKRSSGGSMLPNAQHASEITGLIKSSSGGTCCYLLESARGKALRKVSSSGL